MQIDARIRALNMLEVLIVLMLCSLRSMCVSIGSKPVVKGVLLLLEFFLFCFFVRGRLVLKQPDKPLRVDAHRELPLIELRLEVALRFDYLAVELVLVEPRKDVLGYLQPEVVLELVLEADRRALVDRRTRKQSREVVLLFAAHLFDLVVTDIRHLGCHFTT